MTDRDRQSMGVERDRWWPDLLGIAAIILVACVAWCPGSSAGAGAAHALEIEVPDILFRPALASTGSLAVVLHSDPPGFTVAETAAPEWSPADEFAGPVDLVLHLSVDRHPGVLVCDLVPGALQTADIDRCELCTTKSRVSWHGEPGQPATEEVRIRIPRRSRLLYAYRCSAAGPWVEVLR